LPASRSLRAQGLPEWKSAPGSHRRHAAGRARPHAPPAAAHRRHHAESLYILLGSESGRRCCDDAHRHRRRDPRLAPNKRGSHLALSLERLATLGETSTAAHRTFLRRRSRFKDVARFLVGSDPTAKCKIIDTGHVRARDLALELPPSPLEAVMSHEVWEQIYERLVQLIDAHRTTLIFVNTRRLVERVTAQLSDRLGEDAVAGPPRQPRQGASVSTPSSGLKYGKLKALVATASLELGIDIGDVDLVCQLSSPRSIANFLQRVGRSGHAVGGTPERAAIPAVSRRIGRVYCAARQRCARRARSIEHSGQSARRSLTTDRRRSGRSRMERGRAVRVGTPRLAVP
jgi:ATP-dependent Lhr-like helicase